MINSAYLPVDAERTYSEHYHRVAPTFPPDKSIGQDAVDQIPYLIEFATSLDIAATADWLRTNW